MINYGWEISLFMWLLAGNRDLAHSEKPVKVTMMAWRDADGGNV